MERIYSIRNKWLRAFLMMIAFVPVFVRHCWRKGIVGRAILAGSIAIFVLLKFFPSFNSITKDVDCEDYNIIDLADAYDSGRNRRSTDYIVIHHTAMMSNIKTSVLAIASMHMKEHGWSSIAYQYLIMDGKIYKLHNDNDIAPHTEGYNSSTIGICIHGNYSREHLSDSDKKRLVWLVRMLQDRYKLDRSKVVSHGDLNATECCGSNININDIRECLKNY